MSRKKRYNLKREKRNLFEQQNVRLNRIATEGDLKTGLEKLFHLHQERALQKNIESTFKSNQIHSFHRDVASLFLNNGWLRFYLLESDNAAIAAAYGFIFHKKFSFYQTGFDPALKRFSPGKVMVFSIFEDMFNSCEVNEFDFLGGKDKYKTFWTKDSRQLINFSIFNRKVLSIIEYYVLRLRESLKKRLKTFKMIK